MAAQKSNCASASSVSPSSVAFAATSADSSSRIRPTSSSTAACASRHALPSSTMTSGSTNSVWPLPDASWTMPLTLAARLGPDRHDVAAVAERDDRLLERAAELRARRACRAGGGAGRRRRGRRLGARRVGATRCRAARRRGRSCGRACSAAPAAGGVAGRRRAAAADARRRGPSRGAPRRRASRRSPGTAPGSRRPPRTARPTTGSMSWAAPMPTPARSWSSARAWSVSSSARADDHRVGRRLEGLREAARRRRRTSSASRARTGGNSRSAIERASISGVRGAAAERRAVGDENRHGTVTQARPAYAMPTRGRRHDRRASSVRGRGSRRSGDAGSNRSTPVCGRSMPNAAAASPGPAPGERPGRARGGGRSALRGAVSRVGGAPRERRAHRVDALERLDGADEERRGPARRARSRR